MERRFFAFCALAIVPCGIASGAAARAANDGWDELAHESAAHVARLALGTLDQDLGAAVDSLLGAADLLPNPDTTIEAVRRAMAGDTVSALDPTASGVELMVLFPDDEGRLRFANGMLVPGAAELVGRVTRARVGLYLHGELWSATDPPPSVAVIGRETLLAASRTPGGARIETASVVAMDPRSGLPAAIVALAQPETPGRQAVPLAFRLVIGLLLIFSTGAAWILFSKGNGPDSQQPTSRAALVLLACVPLFTLLGMLMHVQRTFEAAAREGVSRDLAQALPVIGLLLIFSTGAAWILFSKGNGPDSQQATSRAALVLLACVPLFTLLGMLMHVQRTFDAAAREGVSRDLAQALPVIGALGIGASPSAARALSGFHAARVQGGVVTAATLAGDAAALAAVPAPPPSLTTSGVVETDAGTSRYVARRFDRESFMILLAPMPTDRIGALRKRLMLISGVLMGWLLLAGGSVAIRSRGAD